MEQTQNNPDEEIPDEFGGEFFNCPITGREIHKYLYQQYAAVHLPRFAGFRRQPLAVPQGRSMALRPEPQIFKSKAQVVEGAVLGVPPVHFHKQLKQVTFARQEENEGMAAVGGEAGGRVRRGRGGRGGGRGWHSWRGCRGKALAAAAAAATIAAGPLEEPEPKRTKAGRVFNKNARYNEYVLRECLHFLLY
ncbi:hypothetical protein Ndes2526B_g02660 [Nannochloris sp. 'desiccata']